jgi:hypothetical protein
MVNNCKSFQVFRFRFSKSKRLIGCAITLGAVVLLYVGTYISLSTYGRYEPIAVGLHGVKDYRWSPYGFYDSIHPWKNSIEAIRNKAETYGGWNDVIISLFYPLYTIDCKYIHRSELATSQP